MATNTTTSGNDNLNGGAGDDYLNGGAGDDVLGGGAGSDTLDGGSGSDRLNGGSGADTLIYRLAENTGATDLYTGGSGIDTIQLQLTGSEWLSATVQLQIARYVQHLATVKANANTGEVSNGGASDFTFNFGTGTTLTVSMMEQLEVWVDGAAIDFHAPVIAAADGDGAVSEDAGPAMLTDSGSIRFFDVDLTQSHVVSVVPASGNALGGALVASLTNAATGDGAGVVGWTYQASNANPAIQSLAAGQTVTENFTVTIKDGAGKSVAQQIVVTVTGTNDVPSISAAIGTGAAVEDGAATTLASSGSISFDDVDLNDGHSAGVTVNAGNTLGGVLTATVSDAASGAGDGTVSWNYTVANAATQYLATGQTVTESFTVTIDDGHGGTVGRDVVITVTGTNDAPVITAADVSGSVAEQAMPAGDLSDSGSIAFDDVDLTDAHVLTYGAEGGTLGSISATLGSDSTGTGSGGVVSWNYSVSASAVEYLAAGETKVEHFTISLDDQHGGTVTRQIDITITGTNDAPSISAAIDTGAVTEDGDTSILASSGSITFDDVDLSDAHGTGVTANAANTLGGSLTASVSDAATGAGAGTVNWSYSVDNAATQYLAAGQTVTESFTVTIDDGQGGTASQVVTITVTGTNDIPVIGGASTAAVTEDAALELTTGGMLTIADLDAGESAFAAQAGTAGSNGYGSFTVDAAGNWSYAADNSQQAIQQLGAGQSLTDSFTARSLDGTAGQVVTVTINGSNDAPTITVADLAGKVDEDADAVTLAGSGAITFDDVDLADAHSASVTASAGNTLGGQLMATVSDPATGTGNGTVGWSYSVSNAATQYLAAGQQVTESFTITIDDGQGGAVGRDIVITITGTNDVPVITAADVAGDVSELVTPAGNLSDSGLIAFDDVDLTDSHLLTYGADDGTLGSLVASLGSDTSGTGSGGVVEWNYSIAAAAVEYLAAGEARVERFTITIDDQHGGTVSRQIDITITGTNDAPTIGAADVTGNLTEDADSTTLTSTGSIGFDDADLSDGHSVGVTVDAANTLGGILTASVSDAATGTGDGRVSWSYSVDNAATQYLAAGQAVTETFTVTIDDGQGGTVSQQVAITVTGTNDAPVITAADVTGNATEQIAPLGNLTDNGTIMFDDVDLTDAHLLGSAADAGTLGSFSATLGSDTTGSGSGGVVSWSYSVPASAVEYLAAGETKVESFTITIDDQNGGTISRQIEVTVTGTNDAPTISAAVASGAMTEDADSTTLASNGSITFDDVDLNDSHSATVAADADNTLGGTLTAIVSDVASGAGDGTVSWSYSVANAATQYLAAGQTVTEAFTVTIDDGQGGTASQVVTITVTGTNDTPVITSADLAGGVTEQGAPAGNLTDSGTLAFDDVDLTDTHLLTSAAAVGTIGSFSATLDSDSTDSGTGGMVSWNYSVVASAVEYLAAGETRVDSFTLSIDDQHGGVVTRQIDVTITGSNDAPTISVADVTGNVTEDADASTLASSGSMAFDDVDLADVHGTAVAADTANTLGGMLTATVSDAATGAGGGTVNWNYSVDNAATQYLAAGQQVTESFTVTIDDGQGGTASRQITVTITGTNDAPTLSAMLAPVDTVAEDAQVGLSFAGIAAQGNEADADGTVEAFVVKAVSSGTLLIGSSAATATAWAAGTNDTIDATHQAFWTAAPDANGTLDAFTVVARDDAGLESAAPVQVRVAVTPVNDAPTTAPVTLAAIAEDSGVRLITQAQLLANAGDVDGPSLTATGLAIASGKGTLLDNGDGTWNYTPALNDDTAVSFTYQVSDGSLGAAGSAALDITPVNDAASDLVFTVTNAPGNSLPNGAFGQISLTDPDGGSPIYTYSLSSLTATTLSGGGASGFAGDLSVSSSGVVSASNLDDNRVYEMTVQVTQGTASFSETFSIITGTNAVDTVSGGAASGDDVIFAQGNADVILAGSGNDNVFGQAAADQIHGEDGNDTLTGGGGNDTFYFDSALNGVTNVDHLTDFDTSNDKLLLSRAIFDQLSTAGGTLGSSDYGAVANGSGATATSFAASVHIIYDSQTGNLYYDADGANTASGRTLFAVLDTKPSTASFDRNDIQVGP